MNEELYRQKSLDKIKSPENLNDCLRVASPAAWLLVVAIAVLLAGAVIWGLFGRMETVVSAGATVRDGVLTCCVDSRETVESGMSLRLEGMTGESFAVESAELTPEGQLVTAACAVPDGSYTARIVTESLRPLSFLTN